MRTTKLGLVVLLAALAGLVFAAVSTYDSVVHLDRQVHGIHCSYLLGLGKADISGSTGCYATLMSPYSSVLRGNIWGGIPTALAGMSVFAFIIFWTLRLLLTRRQYDSRAVGFLLAATALPLLSSIVMGYLSFVTLGAACKLCIGIYISSAVAFIAAGAAYFVGRKSVRMSSEGAGEGERAEGSSGPGLSWGALCAAFGGGVLFVALPFITFAAIAPDFSHYIGNCGSLRQPRRSQHLLVPITSGDREVEMIEVFDPLCGACKIFEQRFAAMPESRRVSRKLLLFPLDNACNWMVDEAVHPGACTVSEAVLCAGDRVEEVLTWVFEQQDELLRAAKRDPKSTARLVTKRFPKLRGCLGSPAVRARLNKALRWAVKNRLQVLTPQIYVEGLRLCDEDTDLGLEYAISRLVARAKALPAERPLPEDTPEDRPQPAARKTPPTPPPAPGPARETNAVPDSSATEPAATPPKEVKPAADASPAPAPKKATPDEPTDEKPPPQPATKKEATPTKQGGPGTPETEETQ